MAPKISVIITTYRRPLELQRAIESVIRQTIGPENFEIIVVDDDPGVGGSFFGVGQYITHKENRGLSAARNTGIKAAKGEYVVCLDDDNILRPTFLAEMLDSIGDYDAVGCGRHVRAADGYVHSFIPELSRFTSIDWGWLIKRAVFNEIEYDEKLKCNEDTDFGIRFHKKFNAKVCQYFLTVAYDMGTDSLSMPSKRELDGMEYFLRKNEKEYDDPNELRYLYRLAARKFYRGGYRLKGLGYFWKSFLAKPGKSFWHFFFALFGWSVYNWYMTREERK